MSKGVWQKLSNLFGWKLKKPSSPNGLNTVTLRSLVETVIRMHPKECIFAPGAVDRIVGKMWGIDATGRYTPVFLDMLTEAVLAEEIYCPHEGIDRRKEFGLI